MNNMMQNKEYKTAFFIGLAAFALMMIAAFLEFATISIGSYSIVSFTFLDMFQQETEGHFVIAFLAASIIWLLIHKRWACIVGAFHSAGCTISILMAYLTHHPKPSAMGVGAVVMLLSALAILVTCIVRAGAIKNTSNV